MLLIRPIFLVAFLSIIIIFGCDSQKKKESKTTLNSNEKLTDYLNDYATINCDFSFRIKPIFSSLVAVDMFIENEDSIITLLDFMPSHLYYYNLSKNKFIREFKIPTDNRSRAKVYKTYKSDSVLYFNSEREEMIVADSTKILKRYPFNHFYGDSSAKVYTILNRLEKVDDKFGMMIFLNYNSKTIGRYSEIRQQLPVVGLFSMQGDSLHYTPTKFYNPIPLKNGEKRIANLPYFLTNSIENEIIYSYKNTDSIFVYNIRSKKTVNRKISNGIHPLKPIVWKKESPDDKFTAQVEMELANRSDGVTTMIFDPQKNLYYRQINVRSRYKTTKSFLQVISEDYRVIKELEIPDKYQRGLIFINNKLLFNFYNREKNEISYKKFTLANS